MKSELIGGCLGILFSFVCFFIAEFFEKTGQFLFYWIILPVVLLFLLSLIASAVFFVVNRESEDRLGKSVKSFLIMFVSGLVFYFLIMWLSGYWGYQ